LHESARGFFMRIGWGVSLTASLLQPKTDLLPSLSWAYYFKKPYLKLLQFKQPQFKPM
jgi:hypothetical protein